MLGERGFKKLKNRKTKVASWYFDLNMILDYWGCFGPKRFYHHTGMVSNWYTTCSSTVRDACSSTAAQAAFATTADSCMTHRHVFRQYQTHKCLLGSRTASKACILCLPA